MIPSAFDYARATSVEDAVAKLAAAGGAGLDAVAIRLNLQGENWRASTLLSIAGEGATFVVD